MDKKIPYKIIIVTSDQYIFKKIGYELDKLQLDKVYEQFLITADRQKEISDKDLPKIIEDSNL